MHLFLSPHPDDAVLSCGGLIHQLTQKGEPVTILTVMAGDPPDPLPDTPLVRELHQRWKIGENPVAVRRQEDEAAARVLGARVEFLSIPDCIYRTAGGVGLYPVGDDDLFGDIHPDDPARALLLQTPMPHSSDAGRIYVPLGVGNHVDHQLVVAWALEKLGGALDTVFFYEDYPQLKIDLPDSNLFRRMTVPQPLLDFDVFINLAKIKMHMHVGASLGIKNLYGLLCDDERMTFHRQDVNRKVVEILRRFTPDLTILEGIWALEGQAPICGEPVTDFNTIIVGKNPVAVDAVGSEIIGVSPQELATTRLANAAGLGPMDLSEIDIQGTGVGGVKRYLKRPVVSSMGAYPNCEVYELGADIGTMSSLRHALDRMHYAGDLEELPDNTFVLGSPGSFYEPLEKWEGDLWLIGDDVQNAYGDADNIFRVPGSPPHFGEIIRAISGKYL